MLASQRCGRLTEAMDDSLTADFRFVQRDRQTAQAASHSRDSESEEKKKREKGARELRVGLLIFLEMQRESEI